MQRCARAAAVDEALGRKNSGCAVRCTAGWPGRGLVSMLACRRELAQKMASCWGSRSAARKKGVVSAHRASWTHLLAVTHLRRGHHARREHHARRGAGPIVSCSLAALSTCGGGSRLHGGVLCCRGWLDTISAVMSRGGMGRDGFYMTCSYVARPSTMEQALRHARALSLHAGVCNLSPSFPCCPAGSRCAPWATLRAPHPSQSASCIAWLLQNWSP